MSSLLAAAVSRPPALGPSPTQRLTLAPGQIVPGNIDLAHRPVVRNLDGSISTVRSITVTDPRGRAYLIPTVVGSRVVSNDQALAHFQRTGEHLGVFANEHAADQYAQQLHEAQAREYLPRAAAARPHTATGKPLV